MEITLLNETELRVTLTAEDLEHYSIDCAHMDYGTTETRRAFWSILDEARRKTGFDAARDKICIRVYPSTDGGCDMYVTRLTGGEETAEAAETGENVETKSLPPAPLKETTTVYALDIADTEGLIRLCALLCDCGYDLPGDIYALDGSRQRYFLSVTEPRGSTGGRLPVSAVLDEFGTRLASPSMALCLSEHARRIASGHAFRTLAELA